MFALWNPALYHGWGRKRKFFEGWYYKVVSKDEQSAFAFIPGIAMDGDGKKQAFIQVLDGKNLTAAYHKYPFNAFIASPEMHDVTIGDSRFKLAKIEIDLPEIKGILHFEEQFPWPSTWFSPGIMGPFSFVPFIQCYHGILSMDHAIRGTLEMNGKVIDFDGGRGYIEKDWGHSFPEGYIWMQSNHFKNEGVSIKCSVAKIPWLWSSFVGFIAGALIDGKLYRFTTYNSTKLKLCKVSAEVVLIRLENKKHRLEITAHRAVATELAAPIGGFMDARIEESMNARIEVVLTDKKTNSILFADTGRNAGLEVAGNYKQLEK
jgi:hypothetical protein